MDAQSFLDRFAGVLRLDRGTYEGIKRDGAAANSQALLVVVLTGLISGIASAASLAQGVGTGFTAADNPDAARIAAEMEAFFASAGGRLLVIVLSVLFAVVTWYIYAAVAGWAGRTLFGARPDAGNQAPVRNLVGWGYAPGLLNVLGVVPVVGPLISLAVLVWGLVTGIVALRVALDLSVGRAIGTAVVAAVLPVVVLGCVCVAVVLALGAVAG